MKKTATALSFIGAILTIGYSLVTWVNLQKLIDRGGVRHQEYADAISSVIDVLLLCGAIGLMVSFLIKRGKSTTIINSGILIAIGFLPVFYVGVQRGLPLMVMGIAGILLLLSKEKNVEET